MILLLFTVPKVGRYRYWCVPGHASRVTAGNLAQGCEDWQTRCQSESTDGLMPFGRSRIVGFIGRTCIKPV
jgi:hypothetical protein